MVTTMGTPDWQRGVVAAQRLVGSFAAGTIDETVGVPMNAETLIVSMSYADRALTIFAIGATSGNSYPVVSVPRSVSGSLDDVRLILVAPALDEQIQIVLSGAASHAWYVVSDSAARGVVDLGLIGSTYTPGAGSIETGLLALGSDGTNPRALATDTSGRLFTVPTAPESGAGNHPAQELLVYTAAGIGGGADILGPPGAGKRYRLFGAMCTSPNNVCNMTVTCQGSASYFAVMQSFPGTAVDTIPLSGIPLDTNTPIIANGVIGASNAYRVIYTVETV